MKKNWLCLLLLIAFIPCFGQQVYLVPQVSFNVSAYDFKETSSYQGNQRFSPGLTAGLGFNIAMNELRTFVLQPEINYSMRNNRTDLLFPGVNGRENQTLSQKSTMHYLEIPLLARFDFGLETRYYINVGPAFSYAIAGRDKQESDIQGISDFSRKADFDNRFNRTDWSALIGGGIEFPWNDGLLLVDARFSWGFRTLYKSREIDRVNEGNVSRVTVDPEGKNRLFTLGIGYALPLN